jgi:hypothetical protein
MKNQGILSGITAMLLLLTAGCEYVSFALPEEVPEEQSKKLTCPVKFYLEDIEMDLLPSFQWKNGTLEQWREALVRYWPELFSRTPEQALKTRFSIGWGTAANVQLSTEQRISHIVSLLSLGLVPSVKNGIYEVKRGVQVEDLEIVKSQKLEYRIRGNYGLFFFCGTCFLFQEHPRTMFRAFYGTEQEFSIPDKNLKNFLQLFVAELHRLPPDKIQELYLSRKTAHVELLE